MLWLAWRQFRAQPLVVVAVTLLFLTYLWLAPRGINLTAGEAAVSVDPLHYAATAFLLTLPVVLGVFWGAPLVARELESGTYRLIFSQSVSRRRWLLVKLALGGGVAALSVAAASLALTWWAGPADQVKGRMTPLVFAARGIVPVACAVLAFVVGVLAGQILRRTLAAMVVTLLVVAAVQVAAPPLLLQLLARPATAVIPLNVDDKFILAENPLTHELQLDAAVRVPGAWILSRTTVTPAGTEFTGPVDSAGCDLRGVETPSEECRAWLAAQHLGVEVTYVPGSRFWPLQWLTFGVLLGVALGLARLSLWWMERRLT